jgi:hypothetical protein
MPIMLRKASEERALPAYQRPFGERDFRGYFRWTEKFSRRLGSLLYHACHGDEMETVLNAGYLLLRSRWQLKLPLHGMWADKGVWCGLNKFGANGNYYGPCLFKLPITVLNGRQFMVFRRMEDNRMRVFFVEYESHIPVYSYKGQRWRVVNPGHYFEKVGDAYSLTKSAIYDIVLTNPLPLGEYEVGWTHHPRCISGKCRGSNSHESWKTVKRVAREHARRVVATCPEVRVLLEHLPLLHGEEVTLDSPEEDD